MINTYKIYLDKDPYHYWDEVVEDYKYEILHALQAINKYYGTLAERTVSTIAHIYESIGENIYMKELHGIATNLGVSIGLVLLYQYFIETHCQGTFVLTCGGMGYPMLGRTIDIDLQPLLDMTIDVVFHSPSGLTYMATTWPGFIGIITGCSTFFGISIAYRNVSNPYNSIANFTGYPSSILIREVFEKARFSSEKALTMLRQEKVFFPCYIAFLGFNEAYLLIRDYNFVDICQLNRNYILQTNLDYWDYTNIDPLNELIQRYVCEFFENRHSVSEYDLSVLCTIPPVKSHHTVCSITILPRLLIYKAIPRANTSTFGDTSYLETM